MIRLLENNLGDVGWEIAFWLNSREHWQLFKKTGRVSSTLNNPFPEVMKEISQGLIELTGRLEQQIKSGKISIIEKNKDDYWEVREEPLDEFFTIEVNKHRRR